MRYFLPFFLIFSFTGILPAQNLPLSTINYLLSNDYEPDNIKLLNQIFDIYSSKNVFMAIHETGIHYVIVTDPKTTEQVALMNEKKLRIKYEYTLRNALTKATNLLNKLTQSDELQVAATIRYKIAKAYYTLFIASNSDYLKNIREADIEINNAINYLGHNKYHQMLDSLINARPKFQLLDKSLSTIYKY